MKRAIEVVRAGHWPAAERTDTVTLLFDDRYRRRLRMLGDGGLDFLLDLVEPIVLHSGDGLRLEEGGFVEVKAAEEDLVEVRGRDAAAFARIAWHLGNRHLPAQIDADRILIRDDHVIVDMLKGLGAEVRKVHAPFDPEGGAYGQHNHDLGHRHGPCGAMRPPWLDPLYRLLAWLSPAYPIGAFSYSHGVETAVEEGFIKDRASLVTWLESVLLGGTGAVDGALFAAAWRAAAAEDWPAFDGIAERAAAWRGTRRWRWNRASRAARSCRYAHRLAASRPRCRPRSGWPASCRCRWRWRSPRRRMASLWSAPSKAICTPSPPT